MSQHRRHQMWSGSPRHFGLDEATGVDPSGPAASRRNNLSSNTKKESDEPHKLCHESTHSFYPFTGPRFLSRNGHRQQYRLVVCMFKPADMLGDEVDGDDESPSLTEGERDCLFHFLAREDIRVKLGPAEKIQVEQAVVRIVEMSPDKDDADVVDVRV